MVEVRVPRGILTYEIVSLTFENWFSLPLAGLCHVLLGRCSPVAVRAEANPEPSAETQLNRGHSETIRSD
jgi:hypothetical protein